MMFGEALIVLAKAPIAGRVKTRLLSLLSADEAAALSKALLLDQLIHLQGLTAVQKFLVYAPEEGRAMMLTLAPPAYELLPQVEGDIGARMHGAFGELFARGYEQVMLIGGDVLPIPLEYFERGFDHLKRDARRAVIGPSLDGGYYLIGLNHPQSQLFDGMTWSEAHVLADTATRVRAAGLDCLTLPQWLDIDTPADLRVVDDYLQRLPAAATQRIRSILTDLKSHYGEAVLFAP